MTDCNSMFCQDNNDIKVHICRCSFEQYFITVFEKNNLIESYKVYFDYENKVIVEKMQYRNDKICSEKVFEYTDEDAYNFCEYFLSLNYVKNFLMMEEGISNFK